MITKNACRAMYKIAEGLKNQPAEGLQPKAQQPSALPGMKQFDEHTWRMMLGSVRSPGAQGFGESDEQYKQRREQWLKDREYYQKNLNTPNNPAYYSDGGLAAYTPKKRPQQQPAVNPYINATSPDIAQGIRTR